MVIAEDCHPKGRGIESRSFSLLIASFSFIRLFDIIRPINTFHVANDERHARRDEEEGPAGVSGKKMRERSTFDSFQGRGDIN